MDSCELQQQDSGEEGGDENEENVQNSDENTELEKPAPPKPPRIKIEPEAEANIDEFNNNENNVVDKKTKMKVGGKENEIHVRQNGNDEGGANEGDWEIVGRTVKTGNSSEKTGEERKEKRTENQTRATDKANKDPNRPRYTKAEMLEILIERNSLKEKVFALQDELKIYKPAV